MRQRGKEKKERESVCVREREIESVCEREREREREGGERGKKEGKILK